MTLRMFILGVIECGVICGPIAREIQTCMVCIMVLLEAFLKSKLVPIIFVCYGNTLCCPVVRGTAPCILADCGV